MNQLKELDLNLTNRCNLRCRYCIFRSGENIQEELTLNEIKKILYEAKQMGLEDLHLTGGEPVLREDLVEIIRYATGLGIDTRLITNGLLLDNGILNNLKVSGLKSIMFSLDGTKKTNDYMRDSKGAYEKTINAIKEAIKQNFFIRVNSVACKTNISNLCDLSAYLEQLGVNVYSVFLMTPSGRGCYLKHSLVEPAEWMRFSNNLKKLAQSYHMKVVIEKGYHYTYEVPIKRRLIEGPGAGCFSFLNKSDYLIITPDGKVWPCVFLVGTKYTYGNVRQKSLEHILANRGYRDFYSSLSEPAGICGKCEKWEECLGGCKGYANIFTGEWNDTDPRCPRINSGELSYYPLCPIMKINLSNSRIGGSSEQALKQ